MGAPAGIRRYWRGLRTPADPSWADTLTQALDAASATALAATLQLLQDPTQRNAVIAGNPQAAAVDRQMEAMLGTRELQDEFYALAAAIFNDVVQGSGGDLAR